MQQIKVEIKGVAPILMHNGQLADPLNPHVKAIKTVTGKRKKTDEDYERLAYLEFLGGLYVNDKGLPVIPSANIEGALIAAAKRVRQGVQAKAQMMCVEDFVLLDFPFTGKVSPDNLWKSGKHTDSRGVRNNGTARIIRCRPRFDTWSATFNLQIDNLNPEEVTAWVESAGRYIGIGDYRPRFGRFEIVDIK